MSPKVANSESTPQVKPINWTNLIGWARQTAIADRRNYIHKKRPMSSKRLWHFFAPNLQRPIFLVGAPRSGTTFLGSCLAALPEISYHFEPVATKAAARYIYDGQWEMAKARWFYRNVYAWLMRLHVDADLRFAEKTPRNCFLIDFLVEAFPDAQFIHIIRDGRDAALSQSKKPWLQAASAQSSQRESSGYLNGPYARFWVEPERRKEFETTSDIHRCIWAWRRHTESILTQAAKLPSSQYYRLRYEALVKNPEKEGDFLLNYLNIQSSQSRQLFHQALSQAQSSSVGKWQRELSSDQLQQIEAEAGLLMQKLGYS